MKTAFAVVGAAALLAVVGVLAVAVAGYYDMAADEPHWPAVEGAIEWARTRSITTHSTDLSVPAFDAQVVREGAGQYNEMCVGCHLAPGEVDRTLHDSMYPRPPDFTKAAVEPRAAFWTIKHGVKMSGMPAWGKAHNDKTIWSIVAFLQKLPGMGEPAYRELLGTAPPPVMEHERSPGHSHVHPHTHAGDAHK